MAEGPLKLAVFIDFDNIEIGLKETLGKEFDISLVLEALKEHGEVVTKVAYADWKRSGDYSRQMAEHAVRQVQRNMTPRGDKNAADINLALDALEMAINRPHIDAFVIVGGDSDFLPLVEKLKQYDKLVFVVGGRAFTSKILQRNCTEFIAYENLLESSSGTVSRPGAQGRRERYRAPARPLAEAVPSVERALKILADRGASAQLGLLKTTLLQLDSTFSERDYGASSFLDFAQRMDQAGLIKLVRSGRGYQVQMAEVGGAAAETDRPEQKVNIGFGPNATQAMPRNWQVAAPPAENPVVTASTDFWESDHPVTSVAVAAPGSDPRDLGAAQRTK
jgi:uncharacterized protein (TIGR00288 family)